MKPVSWVEAWRSEVSGRREVLRPFLGPGDRPGLVAECLSEQPSWLGEVALPRTGESNVCEQTGSVADEGKMDICCAPVVGYVLSPAGSAKPHDSPAREG